MEMIPDYRPGYWRIFRELFEAALTAMLALALYLTFKFSYVLSNISEKSLKNSDDSFFDILIASLGLAGMFSLVMLPAMVVFVLLVGAPIVKLIYKKYWDSLWVLVFAGGFISSISLAIIPAIFSDKSFVISSFISSFNQMFCVGALTGFLFYRKMKKHIDFKTEQKTSAEENVSPASS